MSNAKYISSILFDNSLSENSYLNDLPIIKYLAANKELKLSAFFHDLCKHVKWHKIQNGDRAGKSRIGLPPIIAY